MLLLAITLSDPISECFLKTVCCRRIVSDLQNIRS